MENTNTWNAAGVTIEYALHTAYYAEQDCDGRGSWVYERAELVYERAAPSFKPAMKADKRSGNLPANLSSQMEKQVSKQKSQVWNSAPSGTGLFKEAAAGFAISQRPEHQVCY